MNLAALGLTLTAGGAIRTLNQFTGSAHNAGRATEHFDRTTKNLTASLQILGGYFGIRQLVEYADTWTLIGSRVSLVTETMDDQRAVMQRLYEISLSTRNSLAATSTLYTRLALNADQLGRSHNDLLNVVEAVNAAMLTSGATGVEAAQSMRQLAQALGSGKVQGDEFRTMMEAMPAVARAIADEMGVELGELWKLAPEGAVTVDKVITALLNKHDELVEAARSMPITVGQAIEMLQTSTLRMVGILNEVTMSSQRLGGVIRWLAENMNRIVAGFVALTAAIVAYRIATMSAYLWTQALVAKDILSGFVELSKYIGRAAATMAALKAAAGGVVGLIAAVVAIAGAWYAYRKTLEALNAATEKYEKSQGDLNKVLGAYKAPVDEEAVRRARELNETIEDMVRLGHQNIRLSVLTGEALADQRIEYDAINKIVEARRKYTGEDLRRMEEAIELERSAALTAADFALRVEDAAKALEEKADVIKQFRENLQRTFAETFFNITQQGIRSFADMFRAVRDLFLRMVSELVAARFMAQIGGKLSEVLDRLIGTSPELAALQKMADQARSSALDHVASAEKGAYRTKEAVRLQIEYDINEEKLSDKLRGAIGPAIAGAFAGMAVGGMAGGNSLFGFLGGGGAGAASAALMGAGPWGVAAAGLTGAISGLIVSEQKHLAELRLHRETLVNNNQRLQELRDQLYGTDTTRYRGYLNEFDRIRSGETLASDFRTWAILEKAAKEFGITLMVNGKLVKGALEQLEEAIQLTLKSMLTFGNNAEDIGKQIEARRRLFGESGSRTAPLEDAVEFIRRMSPNLDRAYGLSGMDPSSPAGRAALLASLQEIYRMIERGELTREMLGQFADKNALIDAILRAKDGLDEFSKVLNKVTTDFPRAMDIAFYEQKFGRYGSKSLTAPTTGGDYPEPDFPVFAGNNITINNYGNETGEEVLNKIEKAATRRRKRGGIITIDRDLM